MGPITIIFEIASVVGFVAALATKDTMWFVFPASFAVSVILIRWVLKPSNGKLISISRIKLNPDDPEQKQKTEELLRMLKEFSVDVGPTGEKCGDPHCPNCHGYGDN